MYFDGRLTEGALLVAKRAKELQIPVSCPPALRFCALLTRC